MAEYIQVAEEEGDEPMEIPVEDDGTLLLTTLSAQFPGSCGLRFRNPTSGAFRGVRVHEGRLYPPDNEHGWSDVPFVAVFPKFQPDVSSDNKRKGDPSADNPTPKTKKLENIKCSDLIVLGLDYTTTEETLKEYFSKYGKTVLCEVKKHQDSGKSRGFGFVKFIDYAIQRRVMQERHNIDGRMCDAKIPASKENDEQSKRVFIGRVPEGMKQEELRDYFKQFGEVMEVFIPKPYRPFAFVTFEDPEVAQSLCGDDHIVGETSLLVRSAAPRKGENSNTGGGTGAFGSSSFGSSYSQQNFNQGFGDSASRGYQRRYDGTFERSYQGQQQQQQQRSQLNGSGQMSNTSQANMGSMNPFQNMNPQATQAFFAAALTQAAQQAAQAAQSQQQQNWPQTQQTSTAQSMSTPDPQAVQAMLTNTVAAANSAWAGMKNDQQQMGQQQQQKPEWGTHAQGTWS